MKYVVETWAPEFGANVQSLDLEPAKEPTNLEVEVPLKDWKPIDPTLTAEPLSEIAFIDGVRRIDARIWIDSENDLPSPGICATVAAGIVYTSPTQAVCKNISVKRYFLTAAPKAQSIRTEHGDYLLHILADDSPEKGMSGIQRVMLELEVELSNDVRPDLLVVYDGPLRGRTAQSSVGMIKTHYKMYLEETAKNVLMNLEPGHCTPIFQILGREPRYSWYLQLPGNKAHPLAGIVRCEISASRTIEEARNLVNQISASLPKFASKPHKDPRAPQNLYPIAGLERELKRRLGDQRLLEHSLRKISPNSI